LVDQASLQNVLLRSLSPSDFALIADHLVQVDIPLRQILLHEGKTIENVYFPESGLCSIVALTPEREMIEAAVFGREGTSDMVLEAGKDVSPLRTFVQAAGTAWTIEAGPYAAALKQSPTFLELILRYQQVIATQMAHTALSHGSFTLVERLARWILMCQDRLGDDFTTVHEFLAMMLAVRRAGVTESLHVLEGEGAIKSTRGHLKVVDRKKLIQLAAGGYGVPESFYEAVIGPFGRLPG